MRYMLLFWLFFLVAGCTTFRTEDPALQAERQRRRLEAEMQVVVARVKREHEHAKAAARAARAAAEQPVVIGNLSVKYSVAEKTYSIQGPTELGQLSITIKQYGLSDELRITGFLGLSSVSLESDAPNYVNKARIEGRLGNYGRTSLDLNLQPWSTVSNSYGRATLWGYVGDNLVKHSVDGDVMKVHYSAVVAHLLAIMFSEARGWRESAEPDSINMLR